MTLFQTLLSVVDRDRKAVTLLLETYNMKVIYVIICVMYSLGVFGGVGGLVEISQIRLTG